MIADGERERHLMRGLTLANHRANKFHRIAKTTINSMARIVRRRSSSLQDPIFKCHAFGVILLGPRFCGVGVCKHLQVVGITDLLARVDVDEDCYCWSLLS